MRYPAPYALKNKNRDILMKSSSGGVFFEIAKLFINSGGVVYGAAFDKNMKLCRTGVDSLECIDKICGSKYLQSNLNDSFNSIYIDLKNEIRVLFVGTPLSGCRIKKFLSVKYNLDLIVTVDILCKGVASPGAFEWYKEQLENRYQSSIRSFTFRCKEKGKLQAIKAVFENKQIYYANCTHDLYYKLFMYSFILRDS